MRSLFFFKRTKLMTHIQREKKLSYLIYGFNKFYEEEDNEY